MFRLYFLFIILMASGTKVVAQNYTSYCHNDQRNGLTEGTGPTALELLWEVDDALPSTLGQAVYTFGNLLVTTRVQFSPQYIGILECRDLYTGELLWNYQVREEAIHYILGVDDYAIYTHDYESDSIYAHHPEDGSIIWRAEQTAFYFAAHDGAVFTCDGDLLANGPSGAQATMRLDRETGEVMWVNSEFVAVAPDRGLTAFGDKAYRVTGTIVTDERLLAIDIETGETLYKSDPIPGDGDQENPMTVGPDGTIFLQRDGGNLYAFRDLGFGFIQLWEYEPDTINTGSAGHLGVDNDGHPLFVDGRLKRLDKETGMVLDSSEIELYRGIITVDASGTVYVNNQTGKFYALSSNLQNIAWEASIPGNVYCAPAIAQNGIMVLAGGGTRIRAYQTPDPRRPLADFTASTRKVAAGEAVDFTGQSSYNPTNWQWFFPGALTENSTEQHPEGIVYEQAGTYSVTLVVSNPIGGDSLVRACMIEVEGSVSRTIEQDRMELVLYPNPVHNELLLEHPPDVWLVVYNQIGQVVLSAWGKGERTILDVSALNSGMYFLSCQSTASQVVRRFVKQ